MMSDEPLSPTKAKKAQRKRQRERLKREAAAAKKIAGAARAGRRRAEAERDALRESLRDLLKAIADYRQTQLGAESVNDGWDQVIAAYAVARDRLAASVSKEETRDA